LRRRANAPAPAGEHVILHDNLSSGNGYKVRLLLAQLGLPFERIEYDIDRGETRTPEFLKGINPNGRIPVLETDEGELLAESDAILFYLAEGTPFLPEGRLGAPTSCGGCSSSSTATSRTSRRRVTGRRTASR
jgi:hypothetical protein